MLDVSLLIHYTIFLFYHPDNTKKQYKL